MTNDERSPKAKWCRVRSPGFSRSGALEPPKGGTTNESRFMQNFDLRPWTRIAAVNLILRASVLECASPLALLTVALMAPRARPRPSICARARSKRQRTGALQDLAAVRRFIGGEKASLHPKRLGFAAGTSDRAQRLSLGFRASDLIRHSSFVILVQPR